MLKNKWFFFIMILLCYYVWYVWVWTANKIYLWVPIKELDVFISFCICGVVVVNEHSSVYLWIRLCIDTALCAVRRVIFFLAFYCRSFLVVCIFVWLFNSKCSPYWYIGPSQINPEISFINPFWSRDVLLLHKFGLSVAGLLQTCASGHINALLIN